VPRTAAQVLTGSAGINAFRMRCGCAFAPVRTRGADVCCWYQAVTEGLELRTPLVGSEPLPHRPLFSHASDHACHLLCASEAEWFSLHRSWASTKLAASSRSSSERAVLGRLASGAGAHAARHPIATLYCMRGRNVSGPPRTRDGWVSLVSSNGTILFSVVEVPKR
jgi:hypothetical protein